MLNKKIHIKKIYNFFKLNLSIFLIPILLGCLFGFLFSTNKKVDYEVGTIFASYLKNPEIIFNVQNFYLHATEDDLSKCIDNGNINTASDFGINMKFNNYSNGYVLLTLNGFDKTKIDQCLDNAALFFKNSLLDYLANINKTEKEINFKEKIFISDGKQDVYDLSPSTKIEIIKKENIKKFTKQKRDTFYIDIFYGCFLGLVISIFLVSYINNSKKT